ncbi:MAG TPA: hypothetical protein PKM99_03415 [Thermotogota bacterium]|nr:hypothetical protein [Thermotogota bacterium]MDD8040700.1 hypothetical protein [Thermotogota bacterium]HNR62991.1 hypothetical protein [Thermotogota bacterium]HNT95141.1 hypothetical protein [Thermotogota bacterium]HOZ11397.1 hypothetical protein [Thermotogota bacterium]
MRRHSGKPLREERDRRKIEEAYRRYLLDREGSAGMEPYLPTTGMILIAHFR